MSNLNIGEITKIFTTAKAEGRYELNETEFHQLLNLLANDGSFQFSTQTGETDTTGFGSVLSLGITNSREFGMIISAGFGGTDTVLIKDSLKLI